MAHKKNPFENIVLFNKKNARAIEYLLKKAPEEDVIDGLRELRLQLKEEEKKSKRLPRTIGRIEKLLFEYPGFQKEILDLLVSRIKSAKNMGIISKYEPKVKTSVPVNEVVKEKNAVISKDMIPPQSRQIPKDEKPQTPFETIEKDVPVKTDTVLVDHASSEESLITKEDIEERIDFFSLGDSDQKNDIPSQNDNQEEKEIPPKKELKEKSDKTSSDILQAKTGFLAKDEFLIKTVRIDRDEMRPLIDDD